MVMTEKTRELARQMTDDSLRGLIELLQQELMSRWLAKAAKFRQARLKERLEECAPAICNFLLGCAHAIACRTALRWNAGNFPWGGTTPSSGDAWMAAEGADLTRRHYNGDGPAVRNEHNQGTYLYGNPLLWRDEAAIRSGLSRPIWNRLRYH